MLHSRSVWNLPPGGKKARCLCVAGCLAAAWLGASVACAQPSAAPAPGRPSAAAAEEQAIRAAAQAYIEALKRGDGPALAEMWTADGDIVDGQGNVLKGRETLAQTKLPAAGELQPEFRFGATQVRLIGVGVAVEDGAVEVIPPGSKQVLQGRFSAVWVKREGAWRLASLREWRLDQSHGPELLQSLDWMVGDWDVIDHAQGDGPANAPQQSVAGRLTGPGAPPAATRMEISVRWNPQRTYLVRDLKNFPPVSSEGTPATEPVGIVSQRIGWDPLSKQIHSWAFSADGGHGEAVWTKEDDSWVARSTSVHPDGRLTSSMNIYTFDGNDECTWQSFQTHAGDDLAPPITMTMVRTAGSSSQ
ncbi:MAG: nuclear transport factor 2 family protein [Planctomycetota bacterium]